MKTQDRFRAALDSLLEDCQGESVEKDDLYDRLSLQMGISKDQHGFKTWVGRAITSKKLQVMKVDSHGRTTAYKDVRFRVDKVSLETITHH